MIGPCGLGDGDAHVVKIVVQLRAGL